MLAKSSRFRILDRPGTTTTKTFSLAMQDANVAPPLAPPPPSSISSATSSGSSTDSGSDERGATLQEKPFYTRQGSQGPKDTDNTAVERRKSERGYSFSIIPSKSKPPHRTSDTPTRSLPRNSTDDKASLIRDTTRGRGSSGGGGGGGDAGSRESGAIGASKLIDIWSQAAALSDAEDYTQQASEAMSLMRTAGARPDALPFTRLINEHARAAGSGDRAALARAFQVLRNKEEEL